MFDIPGYIFNELTPIEKGVSGDKKYCAKTTDGLLMLLRVSDISEYERKKTMYSLMELVAALGVPMSRPIDFGICDNDKKVYQLLSWCDGDTANVLLPKLSETEKYNIGIKSGRILRVIHSIPASDNLTAWSERYLSKNDERVKSFHSCDIKIEGSDMLFSYYEQNKYLLSGRPQCFTHGDYHCDNLMISNDMNVSVIDWDLFDDNIYGDPWNEFTRILNADVDPHFTTGLIRGYFDGEPPEDFWQILKFYFSASTLMLVSWAFYVAPEYLDECKKTTSDVIQWYDRMNDIVPSWYLKNSN
jgi:serine/threonine-protein kinase